MDFKFNLGILSKLLEEGFSLSELVIATKNMFESEGAVGFLRVLLELLDQLIVPSMLKATKHDCCESPYFRISKRELKKINTSIGFLEFNWTRLKCKSCGKTAIPLRSFLGLEPRENKTSELEKIVMEVVSEQSFRRTS